MHFILYAMAAINLLQRFDDAMRTNVALMDEVAIDNYQLIRLLDMKTLSQAITGTRRLFAALGGTLPSQLSVKPPSTTTTSELSGARLVALANRVFHFCTGAQECVHDAVEHDLLAKAYSDLLSALSLTKHIALQVRNGLPLRNQDYIALRIRETAGLYRAFRLQAWLKLSA